MAATRIGAGVRERARGRACGARSGPLQRRRMSRSGGRGVGGGGGGREERSWRRALGLLRRRRRRGMKTTTTTSHQQKVYGLKGIRLTLRREGDEVPEKKPRILAESNAANLNNKGYQAIPSSGDPNRMSERRVRRGSDPIHNRC
uniref:Uncharacterized protein n=1 Tax=Leersia perrieri TaxID=77586 RepID=A0A0D9X887_9ORYZ